MVRSLVISAVFLVLLAMPLFSQEPAPVSPVPEPTTMELIAQQSQLLYQLGRVDAEMERLQREFAELQKQRDQLTRQVRGLTGKLNAQLGTDDKATTATVVPPAPPAGLKSSDAPTTGSARSGGK